MNPLAIPTKIAPADLPPLASREFASRTAVVEYADLEAVGPIWNELLADCEYPTPMQAWVWLSSWWKHFGLQCPASGAPGKLNVLVVYAEGLPIAIFPMFYRVYDTFSLRLRKLQAIGYAGVLDPANPAEEPLALIRDGYARQAVSVVIRHLESGLKKGFWDAYALEALVSPGQDLEASVKAIAGRKPIRFRNKVGSSIVPLPKTWVEYRKSIGKSMRDNLAYYPKRLAKDCHTHTVRIARGPSDVELAVRSVIELHRLRATSDRPKHGNYFGPEACADYFTDVHRRLAEDGRAFVALLEINGRPVAGQAFAQVGDELVVGYSGFDPEWNRYSPLLILQAEVFEQALGNGIRRINLLRGTAQWQSRWRPQSASGVVTVVSYSLFPMALVRLVLYALRREFAFLRRRGLSL